MLITNKKLDFAVAESMNKTIDAKKASEKRNKEINEIKKDISFIKKLLGTFGVLTILMVYSTLSYIYQTAQGMTWAAEIAGISAIASVVGAVVTTALVAVMLKLKEEIK